MPAHSFAQSDISSRLNRLENEIDTLNRAVYKGEKPPASVSITSASERAATEVRIQQLQTELQNLRGTLEEQNHEVRKMREELTRALSDFETRFNEMEVKVNQASPSMAAASAPVAQSAMKTIHPAADAATAAPAQEEAAPAAKPLATGGDSAVVADYDNAFALLKASNYEAAGKGFEDFIAKNPNHELIGNAKYWLGETYYVRGNYDKAARTFADGYQQFPKGPKAGDNLLKLAMSLAGLGKADDACVALAQLKKSGSDVTAPVSRRADQEIERLKCAQ